MHYPFVLRQLGLLFLVMAAMLAAVCCFSFVSFTQGDAAEEHAAWAFAIGAGVAGVVGCLLLWLTRSKPGQLGRREAMLLVALTWLVGAIWAGLPYRVWGLFSQGDRTGHAFTSIVNCYFEAMSGLTTTGATVLTGIHMVPRSVLLWRAATHWLGGLGIVVLFVAVLPSLGVGGKKLFRVEAPGPEPEGVHPHIRETARILWLIYLGLTLLQTVALKLAGLNWFNALCHTFATLATGGFSTTDASIGAFHRTLAVDIIVIVFMVLAGVNFGIYFQLIRRRFGAVWRDTELRVYLAILLVGAAIVVFFIADQPMVLTTGEELTPSIGESIRQGIFTTVSLQTTTGFCTSDFNRWPFVAKAVLLLLMFVGGCAGSTGGGIKVIRIVIAFKVMVAELERVFRPQVVRPVKVGRATISRELRLAILAFLLGHILLFGAGTGLLMVSEQEAGIDITTAATASVATLCNIGPGLARVGAVENYAWFSDTGKMVMSLLMALGRLEVFAILVLFVPRFWRGT